MKQPDAKDHEILAILSKEARVPMKTLAAKYFPGVPMVPMMSTGATDAVFFGKIGMPVYGAPGIMLEQDLNGIHGLDERIRVSSLYQGRDYLFDLVKAYGG